jgi:hypothetical protein
MDRGKERQKLVAEELIFIFGLIKSGRVSD